MLVMDNSFTERLGAWLEADAASRDPEQGALMLLRLSGNVIEYRNLMKDPASRMEYIEGRLQKYYNFRVRALTHAQVAELEVQAREAVEAHIPLAAKADAAPRGKRQDHDALPPEVQALYVENLSLLRRMRELHLQLRKLSEGNPVCPDSERYPFLKELIATDKRLRANWERYDGFKTAAT